MTDYLGQLIMRVHEPELSLQPRALSMFENTQASAADEPTGLALVTPPAPPAVPDPIYAPARHAAEQPQPPVSPFPTPAPPSPIFERPRRVPETDPLRPEGTLNEDVPEPSRSPQKLAAATPASVPAPAAGSVESTAPESPRRHPAFGRRDRLAPDRIQEPTIAGALAPSQGRVPAPHLPVTEVPRDLRSDHSGVRRAVTAHQPSPPDPDRRSGDPSPDSSSPHPGSETASRVVPVEVRVPAPAPGILLPLPDSQRLELHPMEPTATRTVHVTIGRVEIRASSPPPVSARPVKPVNKPTALRDYLKQRNGGSR